MVQFDPWLGHIWEAKINYTQILCFFYSPKYKLKILSSHLGEVAWSSPYTLKGQRFNSGQVIAQSCAGGRQTEQPRFEISLSFAPSLSLRCVLKKKKF